MIELQEYNLYKDYGVQDDRFECLAKSFENIYKDDFLSEMQGNLVRNPPSCNIFILTANSAEYMALYYVIHQKDMQKAYHLYYISTLLSLRSLSEEKAGSWFFHSPCSDFGAVLFSNANHLYPIVSSLRTETGDKMAKMKSNSRVDSNQMLRSAMIQDWETLNFHYERSYDKVFNNKSKSGQKLAESLTFDYDFYKGLMNENTAEVEAALSSYLLNKKWMKSRQRHSVGLTDGEFMSFPAMYYAKLAWICGHEIEINHPMIVSELLPCDQPTSFENPYDFLYDPILDKKEIELIDGIYIEK